jgi:hypothetical protein
MTLSVGLGCLWLVVANVTGMFPSKTNHWFAAYILIGLGIPLLGWITYQNGAVLGLIFLVAGASVLRWPVRYLLRWVARLAGPTSDT